MVHTGVHSTSSGVYRRPRYVQWSVPVSSVRPVVCTNVHSTSTGMCQKVLLHSINGHLRSSLFYDYLLVSDVLDINDLLDTRSLGMYSACMAPHFPALLCSVYRHCSFPRCYTSHCVCPSLNCVFPTALCCAQITYVVSNNTCVAFRGSGCFPAHLM